MKQSIRLLSSLALLGVLIVGTCFATDQKPSGFNTQTQDYNSNTVVTLQSETAQKDYLGNEQTNVTTDTRTQEQIEEDKRQAERDRIEKAIQEIEKLLNESINNGGTIGGNGKDPFEDIKDKYKDVLDVPYLPDWYLKQNNEIGNVVSLGDLLPYLDGLFQYELVYPSPLPTPTPTASQDPNMTYDLLPGDPNEINKKDFEGTIKKETPNGFIFSSQQSMGLAPFLVKAKVTNSEENTLDPPAADPAILIDESPTPQELPIELEPILKITMLPFDFEGFFQSLRDYFASIFAVQPGQAADYIEGQWVKKPDMDGVMDIFPDGVHPGELPDGTEVIVPNDQSELYRLLNMYLQQLYQLGLNTTTVTKYTIVSIDEYHQQTIRTSIPTGDYHWVVTDLNNDNNVLVEDTTHSPYVKALFQGEGQYKVTVSSINDLYRSNKVTGSITEMYVLAGGGMFDGMVISKRTQSFESYVTDDIGPELAEVELKNSGFTANITKEMLNIIQMIDTDGNVRSPASGFSTERG